MISVEGISKEFVTNKKYPGLCGAIKGLFSVEKIRKMAVDEMSFFIDKGEIVGYIGNNGAGKSTTIKMMTGIMTPTSGNIYVDGLEPYKRRKSNAKNIGVVFGQRTQLWWDLPLRESYAILRELYAIPKEKYKNQLFFLDDVLGLSEFIDSSVRTLSLGQRMRADLAASLLHNPKVLYLDEPTIGLDVLVKEKMRKAISEINKNSETTVVLTTHDLEDIEELCERIIIIDAGKKVYDGSLQDIKHLYNYKICLRMVVEDIDKIISVNFNDILKLNKEELLYYVDGKSVVFEFNKNEIPILQIIMSVAQYTQICDIEKEERNLTDIVKAVFLNGIKRNNL